MGSVLVAFTFHTTFEGICNSSKMTISHTIEKIETKAGKEKADQQNATKHGNLAIPGATFDRKDSYLFRASTVNERKEWLLQSVVPILGLLLVMILMMVLYEIPKDIANEAGIVAPKQNNGSAFASPTKVDESCIRSYDFHQTFYCDVSAAETNQTVWI